MKKILICIGVVLLITLAILLIPKDVGTNITFDGENVNIDGSAKLENDTVSISKGGIYVLTWTSKKYNIKVDTTKDVIFVLDNLSLEKDEGAIEIISTASVTFNVFGENNIVASAGKGIYSTAVTNIKGEGKLNITSYEGIKVENLLNIADVKLNVDAKSDCIKANELVANNATFNLVSKNEYVEDKTDGRYALIDGKYIKIAKTDLPMYDKLYSLADSCKGLNIKDTLKIDNSNIEINTTDDAFNAASNIDINSSKLLIYTNDDGITTDKDINIKDSKVEIKECYEGVEGTNIYITNSDIDIVGIDDGLNIVAERAKGKLNITKSDVNILVDGDGLDIQGETTLLDTNMYLNTGDNGIQSNIISINNSNVKSYTYPDKDTYAYIAMVRNLTGEVIFAQKHNKFFLSPNYEKNIKKSKFPYVFIECKDDFKIVDKDENMVFESSDKEKGYTNYLYMNSKIDKDNTYYLVTKNKKEELKFNNVE